MCCEYGGIQHAVWWVHIACCMAVHMSWIDLMHDLCQALYTQPHPQHGTHTELRQHCATSSAICTTAVWLQRSGCAHRLRLRPRRRRRRRLPLLDDRPGRRLVLRHLRLGGLSDCHTHTGDTPQRPCAPKTCIYTAAAREDQPLTTMP